jgi:hypothetical protein
MYNLNFEVKYKTIEEELIHKIELGQNKDDNYEDSYEKEDVLDICQEIYQHEFLNVFELQEFDDNEINNCVNGLWIEMSENKILLDIIEKTKESVCKEFGHHVELENDYIFRTYFRYDIFTSIHKFIVCHFNKSSCIECAMELCKRLDITIDFDKYIEPVVQDVVENVQEVVDEETNISTEVIDTNLNDNNNIIETNSDKDTNNSDETTNDMTCNTVKDDEYEDEETKKTMTKKRGRKKKDNKVI